MLCVRMTSTLSRTNSAAISAKRSLRPSPSETRSRHCDPHSSQAHAAAEQRRRHLAVPRGGTAPRNPMVGSLPSLLRARRERPRGRAAEKRDELAPPHALPQAEERILPHRLMALLCITAQFTVDDRFGSSTAQWRPPRETVPLPTADIARRGWHGRKVPIAAICAAANSILYSITSSARASSAGGTSRPSAFAVVRLMTRSNLVGACTGRSAGFSPLRMRST